METALVIALSVSISFTAVNLLWGRKIVEYFYDRHEWNRGVCRKSGRKWKFEEMWRGSYLYLDTEYYDPGNTNMMFSKRKQHE